MPALAAIALATVLGTVSLSAEGHGSVRTSPNEAALSIVFVAADMAANMIGPSADAVILDLGTIVGTPVRDRGASTVIRRQIGIRLVSASGRPGVAKLRAALDVDERRRRVRVDGVLLSTIPQVIDANAVVGVAVRHTIEIEVPHSEPAGELLSSITWIAEIS